VYITRIQQMNKGTQVHKLGAFGSDLAAISGFFADLWDKPEPSLREGTQAWLLNEAGFDLRASGRLAETVQPMQGALDVNVAKKQWNNAVVAAGNLSELSLVLGRVAEAQRYGQQSVEFADHSGKDDWQNFVRSSTTRADALHQAGRLEEAQDAFREAEAMQKERQSQYPLLYSLQGYQYCDLLLTRSGFGLWLLDGRRPTTSDVRWTILARNADATATATTLDEAIELCRDVQKRATQMLEWYKSAGEAWLLDIALDHLSLGRALLLEHCLTGEASSLTSATEHLNAAVDGLRKAGTQDHLPRGLLARAALRRVIGDPSGAAHDLAEVQESAERSGMRLFQVDALIEEACQQMAKANTGSNSNETTPPTADWKAKANECVAKAKALIEETGYHRRDPEIKYLEQILR